MCSDEEKFFRRKEILLTQIKSLQATHNPECIPTTTATASYTTKNLWEKYATSLLNEKVLQSILCFIKQRVSMLNKQCLHNANSQIFLHGYQYTVN